MTRSLFIHAHSPLHPGTGQSVGAIDLAIAREQATGIPYLPGSSIKGVLRDRLGRASELSVRGVERLFGPPTERASDHAGSLHFGDGHLVFMPIRSLAGTFAMVTSPYLLDRLAVDLKESGLGLDPPALHPGAVDQALVSDGSALLLDGQAILEDLDLNAEVAAGLGDWAAQLGARIGGERFERSLNRRVCVVHDDVMSFLLEHATEVTARIRIDDETKTAADGALWYEESLPAETLLCGLVVGAPPKRTGLEGEEALDQLASGLDGLVQFGGNATVGRGMCRVRLLGGES